MWPQLLFILLSLLSFLLFFYNLRVILQSVSDSSSGESHSTKNQKIIRMLLLAFGQTRMFNKPLVGLLHFILYFSFFIINIELLEIIIDGWSGSHRVLAPILGEAYDFIIYFYEILAVFVILACVIFLARRQILKLRRFYTKDMYKKTRLDALIILIFEIVIMLLFLFMNAADYKLQMLGVKGYEAHGVFPISIYLADILPFSVSSLYFLERFFWWGHIITIFAFSNYIPYSKHLHIFMAFPAAYYARPDMGRFGNMTSVTKEVYEIMGLPYDGAKQEEASTFGAHDIKELSKKNILDAWSCTECGRCTAACPANQTGKQLSPRAIMMKTRDRVEALYPLFGRKKRKEAEQEPLYDAYISDEEIWACTTCNACVQTCPIGLNPLDVIMNIRQYAVMEKSTFPQEWVTAFSNIENNQAPWQYPAQDRDKWRLEI